MGSWSEIIEFQMLRIIISILVFISPVIFCENGIERSDHFESPEMETYGWPLGDEWHPGYIILSALLLIAMIAAGKVLKNRKTAPFS